MSIMYAAHKYDRECRRVKKISSTETTVFDYDGGETLVAENTAWATADPAPEPQVSYLTQISSPGRLASLEIVMKFLLAIRKNLIGRHRLRHLRKFIRITCMPVWFRSLARRKRNQ